MTTLITPIKENTIITTGYIYKLFCDDIPDFYVGFTSRNLNIRLTEHKATIKCGKTKQIFKDLVDKLQIELLETFEYFDKKDILYRERYFFEKLRPSINKYYPIRNQKERVHTYYREHRQEILKKRSETCLCEICGKTYTKRHRSRHRRSKFCLSKKLNNNI